MSPLLSAEKISQRLKEISQSSNLSLNELRAIFSMERAVARIEKHPKLRRSLVFKGGFVLLKIIDTSRFTNDLDILAENISKQEIASLLSESLSTDLNDGCWFGDFSSEDIMENGAYGGIRFSSAFHLGEPEPQQITRLSRIQIDVAFGDRVQPVEQEMKSVLPEYEPLSWRVYPIESIISEKVETLFRRGSVNSRAKDIFDVAILYPRIKSLPKLKKVIVETFKNRGMPIPPSFHDEVSTIDLTMLRLAWKSIQLTEGANFDTSWKKIVGLMKDLDSIRE